MAESRLRAGLAAGMAAERPSSKCGDLAGDVDACREQVASAYAGAAAEVQTLIDAVRRCKRSLSPSGAGAGGESGDVDDADMAESQNESPSPKKRARPRTEAVERLATEFEQAGTLGRLKGGHKRIHAALTRLGRRIDELLAPAASDALLFARASKRDEAEEAAISRLLLQAVAQQLMYDGDFDVVRDLIAADADVGVTEDSVRTFEAIDGVLRSLDASVVSPGKLDLQVALAWARQHKSALDAIGSHLEFELHQLRFLQLIAAGDTKEGVDYARLHFAAFADVHEKAIHNLMGKLVLPEPGAVAAKAAHVRDIVRADACCVHGLPADPPLRTALKAGHLALASLRKYYKVVDVTERRACEREREREREADLGAGAEKQRQQKQQKQQKQKQGQASEAEVENWADMEQFPAPVPADGSAVFHSVAICPVTREQMTQSNYPMLLKCGHIISKESMQRIARSNHRLRCPTCQTDQITDAAFRIYI